MDTFRTFDEAKAAVGDGECVGGTLKTDGTPTYFVVSATAPDEVMQELSYEVRHGEPMDSYAKWCLKQAKATVNA